MSVGNTLHHSSEYAVSSPPGDLGILPSQQMLLFTECDAYICLRASYLRCDDVYLATADYLEITDELAEEDRYFYHLRCWYPVSSRLPLSQDLGFLILIS